MLRSVYVEVSWRRDFRDGLMRICAFCGIFFMKGERGGGGWGIFFYSYRFCVDEV